ncbi:MAG: hypothetical protein KC442_13450 [Thermomicrobiales bacterium]|nr:hypothetical protein [Thermomicrobiales bacterium]
MAESSTTAPGPSTLRRPMLAVIGVLLLLAIVAGAGWWFLSRPTVPDWDRAASIDLVAPAGDAFDDTTPWVSLTFAPGAIDADVPLTLRVQSRLGTPTPADSGGSAVAAASLQPIGGTGTPLELTEAADGSVSATARFPQAGWWRITAETEASEIPATFDFVVPDPNVAGPGAVPAPQTEPEADVLYRQGLEALTTLQSVHYVQWMADGRGNGAISEHSVSGGSATAPPEFAYRAAGGMEAIMIGDTRWVKLPNNLGWTQQEGALIIPPADWGEEYEGATQFTSLGEEAVGGIPATIISFMTPELTEPQRRTAAWYAWWIDPATGHILRETMVSRSHYMLNIFSDYDVPLNLQPPLPEGTPAATPLP